MSEAPEREEGARMRDRAFFHLYDCSLPLHSQMFSFSLAYAPSCICKQNSVWPSYLIVDSLARKGVWKSRARGLGLPEQCVVDEVLSLVPQVFYLG
jgi:hypothetical protein